jgi:hypothetical protein
VLSGRFGGSKRWAGDDDGPSSEKLVGCPKCCSFLSPEDQEEEEDDDDEEEKEEEK